MVMIMPRRSAQPSASSSNVWRHKATATAIVTSVCSTMLAPMIENNVASSAVPTLKWLVMPRHACAAMIAHSTTMTTAVVQPTTRRVRVHAGR